MSLNPELVILYSLSEPTVQPATRNLSLIAQIKGRRFLSNGIRSLLRMTWNKPEHRRDFCLMIETHLTDFLIPHVLTSSDKWLFGRSLPRSPKQPHVGQNITSPGLCSGQCLFWEKQL